MAVSFDIELDGAGNLPADQFATLAKEAEEAGFGGIWKGETSNRDPLVLLSAAAAATSKMAIGTAILHVLARSPVAMGMAAVALNELSNGRLILGIGVANPTLAAWHGTKFSKPLDMARDYIEIVRKTYAGERVAVEGAAFTAKDFRLGSKAPTQPLKIVLAALGPRMSKLAGAVADGVIINLANADAIGQIVEWVRAGAKEAGRDPDAIEVAVKVRAAVNDDETKARDALRPSVAVYTRAAGYRELLVRMGFAEDLEKVESDWKSGGYGAAIKAISDRMLDNLPTFAVKSSAEVVALSKPYIAAGATRVLLPPVLTTADLAAESRAYIQGLKGKL